MRLNLRVFSVPALVAAVLLISGPGLVAQDGGPSPFESDPTQPTPSSPFEDPPQEEEAVDPELPFDAPPEETTGEDPFAAPMEPEDLPFEFRPDDPFQVPATPEPDPFDTPAARPAFSPASVRGLYVMGTSAGMQSMDQLRSLGRDFTDANFNYLFIDVRTVTGTAYRSDVEKSFPYISAGFSNPVREVRGLIPPDTRVIAVVNLLPAYNAVISSRPPDNHPLGRNPGMTMTSLDGDIIARGNLIYMDPGNLEVRAYLRGIVEEICRVTAPDGFLFTGVQYPGRSWGYSERAVREFRQAVGGSGPPPPESGVWGAWRREQLTSLLSDLRDVIQRERPGALMGVRVSAESTPPRSWGQYVTSEHYAEQMQDWVGWSRSGMLDFIVVEVHERVVPQGNILEDWLAFLPANTHTAAPVISLAGGMNFTQNLIRQMNTARSRGSGVMLHHYGDPVRNLSRGFFVSLPNLVFRNAPGRPLPGVPLRGQPESRVFVRMESPPPSVDVTGETVAATDPAERRRLVFSTPTPIATPAPEVAVVPSSVTRVITLVSGQQLEAVVLEATSGALTLQPADSPAIVLRRSSISSIEPPL